MPNTLPSQVSYRLSCIRSSKKKWLIYGEHIVWLFILQQHHFRGWMFLGGFGWGSDGEVGVGVGGWGVLFVVLLLKNSFGNFGKFLDFCIFDFLCCVFLSRSLCTVILGEFGNLLIQIIQVTQVQLFLDSRLSGIISCMCPANERRCYIVTSSLIG